MTRFARAKGSKASNERNPEEATPWGEMKQQLLEKNKEINDSNKRQTANLMRQANYEAFLEETEAAESKKTEWAQFPGIKKAEKKKKIAEKVVLGLNAMKTVVNGDGNKASEESSSKTEQMEDEVPKIKQKKKKISKSLEVETNSELNGEDKAKKPKKKLTEVAIEKKIGQSFPKTDLEKIEKKNEKKLRQLEKKKLKKAVPTQEQSKYSKLSSNQVNGKVNKPKAIEKIRDNKPHERKKPLEFQMNLNGKLIDVSYVDGFPIMKEDAERLQNLRKQMISKGLPRSEISIALKRERRKAERDFSRQKQGDTRTCFHCRQSGHVLSNCPTIDNNELIKSGNGFICFKCGSTEHTGSDCKIVKGDHFPHAFCFICKEQGHLARQCPDNDRGLYPNGGSCNACGDVTHFKRDCPKFQAQQEEKNVYLEMSDANQNPDSLDEKNGGFENKIPRNFRPNKIIKF